jgi:hypothetical protein
VPDRTGQCSGARKIQAHLLTDLSTSNRKGNLCKWNALPPKKPEKTYAEPRRI